MVAQYRRSLINMINSIQEFTEKLNNLDPQKDEFIIEVDELIEETDKDLHKQLYETIFNFFESCPEESMSLT